MKFFNFLWLSIGWIAVTFSAPLVASTPSVGQVLRDQIPISRAKSILLPPGSWQVEAFFETAAPLTGGSRTSQPIRNIVLTNTDSGSPVSAFVASWSEFADVNWGGNNGCNLEGNLKQPYAEAFGTTLNSPTVRCVTAGKFVNFRSTVSSSSFSSNTFVKSNFIHLASKSNQLPLHALVLSGNLRRVRGDTVTWWIYVNPVGAGLPQGVVDRNILSTPLGPNEPQSISVNPINLLLSRYHDWSKEYLTALESSFYPSLFGGVAHGAKRTGLPAALSMPDNLAIANSPESPRPLSGPTEARPEGPAVASPSPLPPCPKNTELLWSNCVGSISYGDGAKYVGEWLDDAYHGLGIYYRSDGTVIRSGRWSKSTFVQHVDLEKNNFPFNQISQGVAATKLESGKAERDRLIAEAETARIRQQELEQKLTLESQERERQAAEVEAVRRRQQELEAQLAAVQSQGASRPSAPAAVVRNAHALVIGNAAYPGSMRLLNPVNDANAISQKLRSLGFTVTTVTDMNRQRLVQSMTQFRRSAASADLSLLFYSGHGVQIFGTNYILPTDVDQGDVAQATIQGVRLNEVVENFMPGKTKLVFLDACRDNPLMRTGDRSVSVGLAPIAVAQGTLISYATKDGQTASDGVGTRNSPFTAALLEHLGDPNDIAVVLRKVREKVMQATGGKQQPWEYGSLTGGELVLSTIRGQR